MSRSHGGRSQAQWVCVLKLKAGLAVKKGCSCYSTYKLVLKPGLYGKGLLRDAAPPKFKKLQFFKIGKLEDICRKYQHYRMKK